jgi:hypothetical protein
VDEKEEMFKIVAKGEVIPEAVSVEEANEWGNSVVTGVSEGTLSKFVDALANLSYIAVGNKAAKDIATALSQGTYNITLSPDIADLKAKISGSINSGTWSFNFSEYKDGSPGLPRDEVALTGEEGTELV